MNEMLDTLSNVLSFVLNIFSSVLEWSLANPIIAISIYIPVAIFLISLVFKLVSSFFARGNND